MGWAAPLHGAMDDVSEQKATGPSGPSGPRPPQVTIACAIVVLGSIFVILLMWDRVAHLHDLETRQALQSFLGRSKLGDDGIGLGGLLTTVKVVSMLCAACAVAIAVQAWQAARHSRSARLAVTILVGPLFLTGLVGDGFVSSAAATFWCSGIAAAAITLWLGPNRVWFGDPVRESAQPPRRPGSSYPPPQAPPGPQGPPGPQHPPYAGPTSQPPPSSSPFGSLPPATTRTRVAPPPPWAPPAGSAYDVRRPPGARPRALLWACVLTWICTSIAAVGLALSLLVMSQNSGPVLDRLYRRNPHLADEGLSRHAVLVLLFVISAVVLVAAVAAAVFAVLVFLRTYWAWYALVISSAVASLLFVLGSLGSPVAIVLLGASIATIVFLVRPEVKAWLLRR